MGKLEVISGYISFEELTNNKDLHNKMMNFYADEKPKDALKLNFLK